ncbi:MAG TPA: hypothetical protein VFP90_10360 [Gemmatimonadaceae bacterium]|nr:hypothetical protein [Gemmatimonadaceae bacterium]
MGGKASNNLQSDRPESGGADRDMLREKSGLLERDREKFASERAKRDDEARERESGTHEPYSIDNEPNNDPNPESRSGE